MKDFLTGLYNRRYFFDTGYKLFAHAARENLDFACAMIDIDYFKKVNDTYGHDAGDAVLCHLSSTLKNRLRETDVIARMGGEEFCILAVNMNADNAEKIFETLRRTVAESEVDIGDGQAIGITVSIGVVTGLTGSLDEMSTRLTDCCMKPKTAGGTG